MIADDHCCHIVTGLDSVVEFNYNNSNIKYVKYMWLNCTYNGSQVLASVMKYDI